MENMRWEQKIPIWLEVVMSTRGRRINDDLSDRNYCHDDLQQYQIKYLLSHRTFLKKCYYSQVIAVLYYLGMCLYLTL